MCLFKLYDAVHSLGKDSVQKPSQLCINTRTVLDTGVDPVLYRNYCTIRRMLRDNHLGSAELQVKCKSI